MPGITKLTCRAAAFAAAAVLCAGAAIAQARYPTTVLVRQGDTVAGVGLVTTIDGLTINDSGSWLVKADTNGDASTDSVLLKDGVLYIREGDPLALPAGASVSSVDSINLNGGGNSGWNLFLRGPAANKDSGIFINTSLVLQEGDISIAPQFTPGTPYIGFFDAKINDAEQIATVASVDDPVIPSSVDRALVVITTSGGALAAEAVSAKEGDALPGQTQLVVELGTGPHESAFNNAGQVLFFADMDGSTTTDGVVYLDGELIAQEGLASPVPGRSYELLTSRGRDLNGYGQWAMKANLDGDASSDEVILASGRVVAQEGTNLPAIGPWLFTSFGATSGPVAIDDLGNVLWYGDWDDPVLTKDTALFLNDIMILREGDIVGSGRAVNQLANAQDAFALSPNGRWIILETSLDDLTQAALRIEVQGPPPVPDGARVPGDEMTASRNPNGTGIDLQWDAAACPAADYNLFYGPLAGVGTYAYTGAACGLGSTGAATFTPPPLAGDLFWLIASAAATGIEGVHGFDSAGKARPAKAAGLCGVISQVRSDWCP